MRHGIGIGLVLAFLFACNGDGDDGDDGTTDAGDRDSGNNTDSGAQDSGVADMGVNDVECDPSFGQASACGGDLNGTWTYRAACGRTPVAIAIERQCPTVEIQADTFEGGSGTLTVAGGSFMLDVDVDVHVEAAVPQVCTIGGCPGTQAALQQLLPQATVGCQTSAAGCDCTVDGPVGSFTNGAVTTNGGVATVDDGSTYYYCVEGNALTYREFGTGADEPVYVLGK